VAIVSAFNEQDIIAQVVRDLIAQRVSVYVLDNGSTDQTAAEVGRFVGRGVIGLEKFPPDGDAGTGLYEWERILKRKEQLAHELDAQWFIHHDADEFREGPWEGLDLAASIEKVDRFGYNAIDFELLNFWPTHDDFRPGEDVRESFVYYELGEEWNKIQIRCWKKGAYAVDLASSGGHEAIFPGRRVFPVRFLLRHYPIRGQAHGMRKVFEERRTRFTADERARGWHRQYEHVETGQHFLRDPQSLTRYDPEAARLRLLLRHRDLEEYEAVGSVRRQLDDQTKRYQARLEEELDHHNRRILDLEQNLEARNRRLAVVEQQLDSVNHALLAREADVSARNSDLDARNRALADVEATLHQRNVELKGLHEQLNARNHEVETLKTELHQRNLEIAVLHRNLDERNHDVARVDAASANLRNQFDAECADLRHQLGAESATLRSQLDAANRDLLRIQAESAACAEELRSLRAALEEVRSSASWRLTAPFRRRKTPGS
jgi:peptidoglycan hydrolase CwlO-like protein